MFRKLSTIMKAPSRTARGVGVLRLVGLEGHGADRTRVRGAGGATRGGYGVGSPGVAWTRRAGPVTWTGPSVKGMKQEPPRVRASFWPVAGRRVQEPPRQSRMRGAAPGRAGAGTAPGRAGAGTAAG